MNEHIVALERTKYPGTLRAMAIQELVRCRDCVHYHTEENRVKPKACDLFNFDVEEDDFCSRGLKKWS